jgi:hypothetical protein
MIFSFSSDDPPSLTSVKAYQGHVYRNTKV